MLTAISSAFSTVQAQTPRSVMDKMYAGIAKARKVTYEMTSEERFGSKTVRKVMDFRINQSSTLKVYAKDKNTGVEILYVNGWNNNKAYINPNGFPWMNVSLSIFGSKVRNESHHVIVHSGFDYITKLMKNTEAQIRARGKTLDDYVNVRDGISWNGRNCYRLELKDYSYKMTTMTCSKNESLYALCDREGLPEYRVMELNNLGYGATVKAGQTLKVPSSFAKRVVFYIDKANGLPIVQMIYDDQGLYEKYEFRNVEVNPNMYGGEWTTQCAGYGFWDK